MKPKEMREVVGGVSYDTEMERHGLATPFRVPFRRSTLPREVLNYPKAKRHRLEAILEGGGHQTTCRACFLCKCRPIPDSFSPFTI